MDSRAIILLLVIVVQSRGDECEPRDFGHNGTVCVCNAAHCDELLPLEKPERGAYVSYTSNRDGLRFVKQTGKLAKSLRNGSDVVEVDEEDLLQGIFGFGGAFTDATGINIGSLPQDVQQKLMSSYFSKSGLEYSLCRVPIGGTDFSTHAYSYCDTQEADIELENFKLADEDFKYKIPFIKWAKNLTEDNLKFIGAAWTAPKWMKVNEAYDGMFGFLKTSMYRTWAEYHLKFLKAYDAQGIRFWAISTGNEPVQALSPSKINSVAWFPWNVISYVAENLGPALRASNYSDVQLLMLDDMRFFLPWFTNWVFENSSAAQYINGIAVHWYFDDEFPPSLLDEAHGAFPGKFILNTEACNGDKQGDVHVTLGSWARGEKYGNSIIQDVNHWVTGWIDWNMALNTEGGPTYIANNVDSPIIVNATSGEFYKQPTYYVLGHFTKFVPPGSQKINSTQIDDEVPVATFKRPDGGVVVVILNKKESEVPLTISSLNKGDIPLTVSAKSITTVVYYD